MLLVNKIFIFLLNPINWFNKCNSYWVILCIQCFFYRTAVDFASALDAIWPFFAGKSVLKEIVFKIDLEIKCAVLFSFIYIQILKNQA